MDQVALHTLLRPGREADYDRMHRTVPPELAAVLRDHGVHEWRIWRDGRDVFHLVEAQDYAAMRAGLRDHSVNLAWQASVRTLFDVPDDYSGAEPRLSLLWSLATQLET